MVHIEIKLTTLQPKQENFSNFKYQFKLNKNQKIVRSIIKSLEPWKSSSTFKTTMSNTPDPNLVKTGIGENTIKKYT